EVKLLEHANAYSAFARDGQLSPIVSILKVEDKDGKIIEEYQPSDKKALSPQVARMINSVLSDNEARSYVFGAKNYLTLGDRPVAAKTGTTNDFHDAWALGYTPSLVAGVWVGNSDNQAMKGKADGSVLAAPIWHDFMMKVLGDTPIEYFKAPDDYKTGKAILDGKIPIGSVKIDKSSGLLATSSTPLELIEDRPAVVHHSILYYVNKDNPRGPVPNNPENDPQFSLWERAVTDWAAKNATSSTSTLPIDYDGVHKPENKPTISILSPLKNQTINVASLDIEVSASALRGISRIEYYINGNLLETKSGNPGSFSQPVPFLNNGYHTLKARACDDVENCTEATVDFNLVIKDNPVSPGKNSIKIISPGSGLAITGIDFPINISAQIGKPERAARIDLIFKNQSDGLITTLKTIRDNISGSLATTWDSSPGPTSGDLYFNLYDWDGNILKSNLIRATIN
ncbi:MAG: Ig-like domain-containing protein, partial [Patescibacteria group bacterium]